jgi:hypothetical protein
VNGEIERQVQAMHERNAAALAGVDRGRLVSGGGTKIYFDPVLTPDGLGVRMTLFGLDFRVEHVMVGFGPRIRLADFEAACIDSEAGHYVDPDIHEDDVAAHENYPGQLPKGVL